MTSCVEFSRFGAVAGMLRLPDSRRSFAVGDLGAVAKQALPSDSIGVFTLTLQNLVPGSAVLVRDQGGTATMHSGIAGSSTLVIPLQAFAGGSARNNLVIKVRKGSSAPFYIPWETLTTAFVGAQTVYVSQIPDQ